MIFDKYKFLKKSINRHYYNYVYFYNLQRVKIKNSPTILDLAHIIINFCSTIMIVFFYNYL